MTGKSFAAESPISCGPELGFKTPRISFRFRSASRFLRCALLMLQRHQR